MAFSKSEVNRAGALLARHLSRVRTVDELSDREVIESGEAIDVIEWWRGEHARPLSRVAANLRYYAAKTGPPVVAQRLKRVPTIVDKLQREPKMNLARMGDIGGVRAVLPDQEAAYRVAAHVRRNWTITRFSDYVQKPKPDGYRALHLINRHRGQLIEIQLRTPRQDRWANMMERFSRSTAPGLKFGGGPSELRQFFLTLGEFESAREDGGLPQLETVERMEELAAWVLNFVEQYPDEP